MTRLEIEVNGIVVRVKRNGERVTLSVSEPNVDLSLQEAGWIVTALIEITDEIEKPSATVHDFPTKN